LTGINFPFLDYEKALEKVTALIGNPETGPSSVSLRMERVNVWRRSFQLPGGNQGNN